MSAVRLVLLAVVLGIALMHHLGGVPHAGSGCAGPLASTSVHTHHHDDVLPAPQLQGADPAEAGGLLHLCLAILVAGATVLVLLLLGVVAAAPASSGVRPRPDRDGRSRAPPAPRRLAQLQVLRV